MDEWSDDILSSEPPERRWRGTARTWRIVGAGTVAVLLGLAFSLRAGVTLPGGGGGGSTPPKAAATASASSPPAAPPIRIASARAVADGAWYAGGGQAAVAELTADANRIAVEYVQQNYNALASDCSRLGSDVAVAQAYRPMPDSPAQNSLALALGHLQLGSQACMYGVSNSLNSQLNAGNDEIRTGTLTLMSLETQLTTVPPPPTYGF